MMENECCFCGDSFADGFEPIKIGGKFYCEECAEIHLFSMMSVAIRKNAGEKQKLRKGNNRWSDD
jgi:hypothetical protein